MKKTEKDMNAKKGPLRPDRRTFLTTAVLATPLLLSEASKHAFASPQSKRSPKAERATATDFSRSYCYYIPKSVPIWVRIQIECRCELIDRATGNSDEYFLSVRTQTGLRSEPPSDALDPGYDFWMIFSKKHIFIKRVHTSSYNNNPSRLGVDEFVTSGGHLQQCPARPLRSGAEVAAAFRAWQAVMARTEFASHDGSRTYAIEYPVKWSDGNPDNTFRVETGPVVLLDPNRVEVGKTLEFDDFQWAYLDYHSFDRARCFLERPTSIFSGATCPLGGLAAPRNPALPALTPEQVDQIEKRLYTGWEPPIPVDGLRKLLQTDHYSAVEYVPVVTRLYALDQPCKSA